VVNDKITCAPIGVQALRGLHVKLVRTEPDYTDFIYACYQNDDFMDRYRLAQNRNLSKTEIRENITAEHATLPQDLNRIEWIILKYDKQTQTPIGIASLADYQASHRRAEFLLGISDERYRKGFLGLEASLLIFDFAFNLAQLHKLVSFVYGYNDYAQKNTLHLGFKLEGLLRDHIQSHGGFIDLFQNGLLKTDFLNNTLLKRLSLRLLKRDITQQQSIVMDTVSEDLIEKFNQQITKSNE